MILMFKFQKVLNHFDIGSKNKILIWIIILLYLKRVLADILQLKYPVIDTKHYDFLYKNPVQLLAPEVSNNSNWL